MGPAAHHLRTVIVQPDRGTSRRGWCVEMDTGKMLACVETQAAAQQRAVDVLMSLGGGHLVIVGPNGGVVGKTVVRPDEPTTLAQGRGGAFESALDELAAARQQVADAIAARDATIQGTDEYGIADRALGAAWETYRLAQSYVRELRSDNRS